MTVFPRPQTSWSKPVKSCSSPLHWNGSIQFPDCGHVAEYLTEFELSFTTTSKSHKLNVNFAQGNNNSCRGFCREAMAPRHATTIKMNASYSGRAESVQVSRCPRYCAADNDMAGPLVIS